MFTLSTDAFSPQDNASNDTIKFHMLNNSKEEVEHMIYDVEKHFNDFIKNDTEKSILYVPLRADFLRLMAFCSKVMHKQLTNFTDYYQINHLISVKLRMIAELLFKQFYYAFARCPQNDVTPEFIGETKLRAEVTIIFILAESLEMKQEGVFSANFLFGQCIDDMLEFLKKIGASPEEIVPDYKFRPHERDIRKHSSHWFKMYCTKYRK